MTDAVLMSVLGELTRRFAVGVQRELSSSELFAALEPRIDAASMPHALRSLRAGLGSAAALPVWSRLADVFRRLRHTHASRRCAAIACHLASVHDDARPAGAGAAGADAAPRADLLWLKLGCVAPPLHAAVICERILARSGADHSVDALRVLAEVCFLRGDLDLATQHLDSALLLVPDDIDLWVLMARVFETRRMFSAALLCLQRALQLCAPGADSAAEQSPEMAAWTAEIRAHTGIVHLHLHDWDAAREYLEDALRTLPSSPVALLGRYTLALLEQRGDDAWSALQQLLSVEPLNDFALSEQRRLSRLAASAPMSQPAAAASHVTFASMPR